MNIYDISNKAGVSTATVSRVLNDSTQVSEKTKQKVLKVIQETGYTPNAFARGLGLNSMSTVGIMCASASGSFLSSAIYFVEQALRKQGYHSLLCCTGPDFTEREKYMKLLISKGIDAIVLVGSNFIGDDIAQSQYIIEAAKSVPIIIVSGFLDGDNIYSVTFNNTEIVHSVTKKMIEAGHDRILYLNRSMSFSGKEKMQGFTNAFQELGLPDSMYRIKLIDDTVSNIKQQLLEYAPSFAFNGVIASDDQLGIGAVKYACANGICIPEELSIVGYNNSSLTAICDPELSSIDNRLEYACTTAVNVLVGVFNGDSIPSKTVISSKLITRGTTDF